jgi:hypothetical protein
MTHMKTSEMQSCIDDCTACHAICEETVHHCLGKGGKHADPAHIALLQTCAQICTTSADAMLRGTREHAHICRACEEICRACAESCERMADDEAMQRCASACRRCAESCRRMAA